MDFTPHTPADVARLLSALGLADVEGLYQEEIPVSQATPANILEQINAVMSGVGDIRRIVEESKERLKLYHQRTILLVDEIHRFNKAQQDALLPDVEEGIVTLVGATTANPFFAVNSALVSRSQIFQFQPLSPDEETSRVALPGQEKPEAVTITAGDYEEAYEEFNRLYLERRWGDGLPLVPPTKEAVQRMLAATDRSADQFIGRLPYRGGIITVGKIAVNAVMAGARPEYLPVVIAAMDCLAADEGFHHVVSSEGSFTLAIVVTGALGEKLGMNSGVGLLGHGWRANNTVGRAVRLCLNNIGYLRPGEIDMALIGRPSSHTFYTFAENQKQSPWEPYHVGRGFPEEDSCVTVSTVGGATGFGMRLYGGGVVEPWSLEAVLETMVKDVAGDRESLGQYRLGVGNPFAHLRKHVMIIHPELAILLQRRGFSRQSLVDYLFEAAKVPYEELSAREVQGLRDRIHTKPGGPFFANDAIPEDQLQSVEEALGRGGKVPVVYPRDLHVIVSGAIPGYSFGMGYFRTAHMTRRIDPAL